MAFQVKAMNWHVWTKQRGSLLIAAIFGIQLLIIVILLNRSELPSTTETGFRLTPYIASERAMLPAFRAPPRHLAGLQCLQVVGHRGLHTIEGLGAVFRLNQVVPFLASYYKVKLGLPSKPSEHDYDVGKLFSDCGYLDTYASFPPECTIFESAVYTPMCARADCECLADAFHEVLSNATRQGCKTVGFMTDRFKTLRYSGCIKPLLLRYFGTVGGARPSLAYDVVHYRMGDLANLPGGKSFSINELGFLIHALCKLSERDIVVVTEGVPHLPQCRHGRTRVVLASDTSLPETFQIMQHAHSVSVGVSGFAYLLAEIATPQRMVVLDWHARSYRWVECEKWTLITKGGSVFHFESRLHMEQYAMSASNMEQEISFLNPGDARKIAFNLTVADRVWTADMMKPVLTYNVSNYQ